MLRAGLPKDWAVGDKTGRYAQGTYNAAIDLAIENNLDVEVERDNIVLADTDLLRARGGGSTRGLDLTVQEAPAGATAARAKARRATCSSASST